MQGHFANLQKRTAWILRGETSQKISLNFPHFNQNLLYNGRGVGFPVRGSGDWPLNTEKSRRIVKMLDVILIDILKIAGTLAVVSLFGFVVYAFWKFFVVDF